MQSNQTHPIIEHVPVSDQDTKTIKSNAYVPSLQSTKSMSAVLVIIQPICDAYFWVNKMIMFEEAKCSFPALPTVIDICGILEAFIQNCLLSIHAIQFSISKSYFAVRNTANL
jgi:hypothetical protein